MNKIVTFAKRAKNRIVSVLVGATSAAILAVAASAEETVEPTVSDQIIGQFQSAADDITPIIIGVLGVGLGIFVIFVGIKLGKKMFSTVSKGS